MGKKEITAAVLDPKYETFVVYIAFLSSTPLVASFSSTPLDADVHLFCRPQISGLITEKALIKVLAKYLDFADKLSLDLMSELPEHIRINNHTIELVNGQQPPYGHIYSLGPVELEIIKAYIKTNLANRFIRPSKSHASAPILFNRKSNGFFQLCVNY